MRHVSTASELKILDPKELEALLAELQELCRRLPVRLLYLHGAYARGTPSGLSDLDLAVRLEPGVTQDTKALLAVLSELTATCRRDDVDIVVLDEAGTMIKDRVVRHGRLVYQKDPVERLRFEVAAVKEALDYRYFSEQYNEALFRQIQEGRFLG